MTIDKNINHLSKKKTLTYLPIPFKTLTVLGFWGYDPKNSSHSNLRKLQLLIMFVYFTNAILQAISFIIDVVNHQFDIINFGLYTTTLTYPLKGIIVMIKGKPIATTVSMAFSKKWTETDDPIEKKIIHESAFECQ